jgi:DNA topoisomerase-1
VSHAGVNATLPSDITPDQVTLAQAVELLDARAAKTGGAPSARRKSPRRAKAAAPAAKEPKQKPAPKKKKAAK